MVGMPHKITFNFSKFDILAIQRGHDSGIPAIGDCTKLLIQINGLHPTNIRKKRESTQSAEHQKQEVCKQKDLEDKDHNAHFHGPLVTGLEKQGYQGQERQ